ncbi:MAG TPA: alanine racemase, partial [Vicinamibacterales bacterium]|nr:alanine racemase [Vicinamibacterales bacterium]
AGPFHCIQSIDSVDLLTKVDAAAAAAGVRPEILVQADLAGEVTKFGAAEADVESIVRAALDARAVQLAGLMIVPPWSEEPELTRPWFVRLRQLRDRLLGTGVPADALRHLSMGMSHDFDVAIEEGATIVRVGTAIFGKRTYA